MEAVSFTLRPLDLLRTPLDRWLDVPDVYADALAKRSACLCRELPYEAEHKAAPSFPFGYLEKKTQNFVENVIKH
jgi:hypothetical protein